MSNAWRSLYLSMSLGLVITGCDSGGEIGDGGDDEAEDGDGNNDDSNDDGNNDDSNDEGGEDLGPEETIRCDSLIDDLEHGMTPLLQTTDGRVGAWYTYNDGTEGATQMPAACGEAFPAATGGAKGSTYSARSSGSGFPDYAGFGFDLNNMGTEPVNCNVDFSTRMSYDASQYTGISFYAKSYKGALNIDVKIPSLAETPIDQGGACDPEDGSGKCENSYQTYAELRSTWKAFEIPFSSFTRPSWGRKFDLDVATLVGIQFQPRPDTDFDVAIDHICFYK